jgi:hypothetical protein
MGDISEQPPDNWPPAQPGKEQEMEQYKDTLSPLKWDFTEEQNRRKLKWLQKIINASWKEFTAANLGSSLYTSDIIRREWFTKPELKRMPKIRDLIHLLHYDKARGFEGQEAKYNMTLSQIKELHNAAFSSMLAPPETMMTRFTNCR